MTKCTISLHDSTCIVVSSMITPHAIAQTCSPQRTLYIPKS